MTVQTPIFVNKFEAHGLCVIVKLVNVAIYKYIAAAWPAYIRT